MLGITIVDKGIQTFRHFENNVAAFAAISAFGSWRSEGRYYRPIPEWIAGFGSLSATTQN